MGSRVPDQVQYAWASCQETWTTGWFWRAAKEEPGPSGRRQSAPETARHHGVPATAGEAAATSPVRKPAKTKLKPKDSASVTWPVAFTKDANCALVTVVGAMRKAPTTS